MRSSPSPVQLLGAASFLLLVDLLLGIRLAQGSFGEARESAAASLAAHDPASTVRWSFDRALERSCRTAALAHAEGLRPGEQIALSIAAPEPLGDAALAEWLASKLGVDAARLESEFGLARVPEREGMLEVASIHWDATPPAFDRYVGYLRPADGLAQLARISGAGALPSYELLSGHVHTYLAMLGDVPCPAAAPRPGALDVPQATPAAASAPHGSAPLEPAAVGSAPLDAALDSAPAIATAPSSAAPAAPPVRPPRPSPLARPAEATPAREASAPRAPQPDAPAQTAAPRATPAQSAPAAALTRPARRGDEAVCAEDPEFCLQLEATRILPDDPCRAEQLLRAALPQAADPRTRDIHRLAADQCHETALQQP